MIRLKYHLKRNRRKLINRLEKYLTRCITVTDIDREYYLKIEGLLPQLGSYKPSTIRYIKRRGLKKGCLNLKSYYRYLQLHEEERDYLSTSFTLKGTQFFRGEDWPIFDRECLSSFEGRKHLRIWCAGCSNGMEVYSLILLLLQYIKFEDIDVLASDYDAEFWKTCKKGEYSLMHLEVIPEEFHHYLIINKDSFTFIPEITGIVHTQTINLLTEEYPNDFNIILCRNVIKFFTPEKIREVQEKLASSLAMGGYLFLSDDDKSNGTEMIKEPALLGLRQICDKCIYQKVSEPQ